ncbi:hypothetical protein Purlil1_13028 [Purpureocillium lilacinum]|uniref:C2H2-type domain-containing protein n=1 Tax=Purpureocillium lilacinum TaxID=33203 RepID=A0ABR0BFF3_PURLI|nr:hypothetical protein Purlil1_13028 [Purpureocillium lilacinum]
MASTVQHREPGTSFRHVKAHDTSRREARADILPRIDPVTELRPDIPLLSSRASPSDEGFVDVCREHGHGSWHLASIQGGMGSSGAVERAVSNTVDYYGGSSSCSRAERYCSTPPISSALLNDKVYFRTPADIHADSLKMKLDRVCVSASESAPRSLVIPFLNAPSQKLPDLHPPSPYTPSHRSLHGLGSPYSTCPSTMNSIASVGAYWFHNPMDQRLNSNGADADRSNAPWPVQDCGNDPSPTQRSDDLAAAKILEIHGALLKSTRPVGHKQEAQSSCREQDLPAHAPGQSDTVRPEDVVCRGTPKLELAAVSPASFVSAASPFRIAVPVTGHGTTSPGHVSSYGVSRTPCDAPHAAAPPLTQGSNMSLSGEGSNCTKNSLSSSTKHTETQNLDSSELEGAFACECCPKKPKKFATAEALSAHEAEKLYECSFCGSRFKNKNEALRHQESLHVRRRSWACSAISEYKRTFHDSKTRPGEYDACGYCGKEFPRSGCSPGSMAHTVDMALRHATEHDWEERFQHVNSLHNFRQSFETFPRWDELGRG